MTGRKKVYWFDEDRGPMVGWVDVDLEWEDPTFESVIERCEPPSDLAPLRERLARLTDKQRFVISASWGLDGVREHSFHEIAALMGVSYQAVQGIYARAMEKMRGVVDS